MRVCAGLANTVLPVIDEGGKERRPEACGITSGTPLHGCTPRTCC
jgi:hypothetical protein